MTTVYYPYTPVEFSPEGPVCGVCGCAPGHHPDCGARYAEMPEPVLVSSGEPNNPNVPVGARVRSHDFGFPAEREGRHACFVEGVVEKVGPCPGCAPTCPHYHIHVTRRVFAGREETVKPGEFVFPALNWNYIEVLS